MTTAEHNAAIAALGRQIAGHCEALEADDAMPDDLASALMLAGCAMHRAAQLAQEAAQEATQAMTEAAGVTLH